MKKIIVIVMFSWFGLHSLEVEAQTIQWTSFDNLTDSLRKERRPLLVFIHTDWCKYCKMMEVKTFTDPLIVNTLNRSFYCLDLNAEEALSLTFLNKKYKFKPSGVNTGIQELAEILGTENGKLSYPTTVFFDQNLQVQNRVVGALEAKQLLKLLPVNE
ncbi:thioredoxin family protein [Runella sp.]|jgi:thioredoxin-related protein|uniref:thioredoxin family protein n=1 Tax=Runella sp. TaxID=1960881 RepID=UPI002610C0E4|nr:thioredoxin family protein [Runella sp.]